MTQQKQISRDDIIEMLSKINPTTIKAINVEYKDNGVYTDVFGEDEPITEAPPSEQAIIIEIVRVVSTSEKRKLISQLDMMLIQLEMEKERIQREIKILSKELKEEVTDGKK